MKTLIIDPKIAGISGDMFISALLDLTGSFEIVKQLENAINELENCQEFKVDVVEEKVNGIMAKKLDMKISEERLEDPKDLKDAIVKVSKKLNLSEKARKITENIIDDLIYAEKKLHKDHFHLHEVASLDTIFDVVGSVFLLDKNGFLDGNIYSTPPALGGGYVKMEHGIIPAPAPATLEILCKHKIKYSNLQADFELTTPTGAAILVNVIDKIVDVYPPTTPIKVGYGAGIRRMKDIPNVLRVVEGMETSKLKERSVILETNVDDVPGEVIGYTVERLLREGAPDVFVTSAMGKKNRPVDIISVIAPYSKYEKFVEILMEETGTLGVRINEFTKIKACRSEKLHEIKLCGKKFQFNVKISKLGDKVVNIKPEYEDLKKIANELNIPLRSVVRAANEKIREVYNF